MPLYDWKCIDSGCECEFEQVAGMNEYHAYCPACGYTAERQFSPNRNILIPGYFRLDRGWHLPPGGSDTASSPDVNSRVRAPARTSFKQQFDNNWKQAGGG